MTTETPQARDARLLCESILADHAPDHFYRDHMHVEWHGIDLYLFAVSSRKTGSGWVRWMHVRRRWDDETKTTCKVRIWRVRGTRKLLSRRYPSLFEAMQAGSRMYRGEAGAALAAEFDRLTEAVQR